MEVVTDYQENGLVPLIKLYDLRKHEGSNFRKIGVTTEVVVGV